MKRFCTLLLILSLLLSLAARGEQASAPVPADAEPWAFPAGDAPGSEYERVFWYGFAAEAPDDPDRQVTEKEMVDMLTRLIAARGGDLADWHAYTAKATDTELLYRDYGALLMLFAAERMEGARTSPAARRRCSWAVKTRTGMPSGVPHMAAIG